MKIYLHLPREKNEDFNQLLISTFKNAGVLLVTNIEENYEADFSQKELKRMKLTGENLLNKMDGFVIEATNPDPDVGYVLAHAISQHKPTLYLIKKGSPMGRHLQRLPNTVEIRLYENEAVVEEINSFMRHIEQGWGEAIANIKFTLRITPQIERYLQWKNKTKKVTKADFLREHIITDIIENDEEYQQYLKRK